MKMKSVHTPTSRRQMFVSKYEICINYNVSLCVDIFICEWPAQLMNEYEEEEENSDSCHYSVIPKPRLLLLAGS